MAVTKEQVRAALKEMERTETLLDDYDYLTDSPRLQRALKAAEEFRNMLDAYEQQLKAKKTG